MQRKRLVEEEATKERRDEELGQEDELEVLEARRLDGDEEEGTGRQSVDGDGKEASKQKREEELGLISKCYTFVLSFIYTIYLDFDYN